jgi:hypothetical protein
MADPYGDMSIFPSESPTASPMEKIHRWNRRKKLIYVLPADPLLSYFSFFFLIPTLPICKQPAPLPLKQKSPSSQHNKLYFLKFCGHSIRVLIYQRILSIFVSNSIFLNFNISLNVNFIVFLVYVFC